MSKEITVTEETFQSIVIESSVPVLVDFWAEWCPPCLIIVPFLEQMSEEYDGRAKICRINVDENRALAQKYGIMSIPTLLFFKGGEIKDQAIGALPKDQLVSRLDALM